MSSMYGLFAVQGQAAYNSAKFAVWGFTEAQRQEMAVAGHPVKVTCVHPGYTKTPLIRNSTAATGLDTNALNAIFNKVAITSPQRTAKIILNVVAKSKARVLPGADAKLFDFVVRLTGSGYMRLFVPMNRRPPPAHAVGSPASGRCPQLDPPRGCANATLSRRVGVQTTVARGTSGWLPRAGVRRGTRQPPDPGQRRRPPDAASAPAPRCPARLPPR